MASGTIDGKYYDNIPTPEEWGRVQAEVARLEAALREARPVIVWAIGVVGTAAEKLRNEQGKRERAILAQVDAALSDAGEGCVCDGPPPQPCGPKCKYPYTDQKGGPYYSALVRGLRRGLIWAVWELDKAGRTKFDRLVEDWLNYLDFQTLDELIALASPAEAQNDEDKSTTFPPRKPGEQRWYD